MPYNNNKNKIKSLKNTTGISSSTKPISLISKKPDFLNDISSIIDCLQEGNTFKLVNKKLMELIFTNIKELKEKNVLIKYYAGYNKIIIEHITDNEKNALLIIDPLDKN